MPVAPRVCTEAPGSTSGSCKWGPAFARMPSIVLHGVWDNLKVVKGLTPCLLSPTKQWGSWILLVVCCWPCAYRPNLLPVPKSSKRFWAPDQQIVLQSRKMSASWLASRKAKSCQQNILQLSEEHIFTLEGNSGKGFVYAGQLSIQSVVAKCEFSVLNEWMHKQIKIS